MNSGSETVNEFFDNAFFINEQFAASKALKWKGEENEKICAVPSAYLIDSEIQKYIISEKEMQEEEELEQEEEAHDDFNKIAN